MRGVVQLDLALKDLDRLPGFAIARHHRQDVADRIARVRGRDQFRRS